MPVVVTPPPITMPPGPAPVTKSRLAGKEASSEESRLKPAREKPARNVLSTSGEKDMRLLYAGYLHAQSVVGSKQRIGQRDQAVAVVNRIGA